MFPLFLFSEVTGVFHLSAVLGTADEAKLGFIKTFVSIEQLIVFGPNKLVVTVVTD